MLGITNVKNNLIINQEEPTPEPEPVITYSEGLTYSLLANDTYSVTGIGTCTDLDINIPPTYNGKDVTEIGDNAFGTLSLKNVTLPNSITILNQGAFRYCYSLKQINLGNNVLEIAKRVLYSSGKNLIINILTVTPPIIYAITFVDADISKIIVPQGTLSAYQSATNWSNYASKMEEAS